MPDTTTTPDQPIAALPKHATERLVEMRGRGEENQLFTSDLSTSEFLLVKEAGFDPVGLVVGSSIYHVGYQSSMFMQNQEMTVLTQAMYHARELAMDRMEEEAHELGADGVVGVRLEVNHKEWGNHIAEFVAIGTAVRHRGDPHRYKNKHGRPFTSDLSGQDFYILLRSGYRPLGMVMGNCVYHIAAQNFANFMRSMNQNVELTQYTQALYDSRELAMERMQKEAEDLGARGIVGANIHERTHAWGAHVIEFFAIGTAVLPIEGHEADDIPDPKLVLSVNS